MCHDEQDAGKWPRASLRAREAEIAAAIDGAPEVILPPEPANPEGCPVTPLGVNGLSYFYFNPLGQLVELRSSEHHRRGIKGLFCGELRWCRERFPAVDRKTGEPIEGSWSDDAVGTSLMKACGDRGLFDINKPIRYRGVWRLPGDQLLIHAGDTLTNAATGELLRAGRELHGAYYVAMPRVAAPAATPADIEIVETFRRALKLWNFRQPIMADLIFGFYAAGVYGGAPSWRAHMLVRAQHGSGKSWLAELMEAAFGAGAHPISTNFTEAGLRQALNGEARVILLDEAEATTPNSNIRRVVELLRHMSGGGGSRTVRGSIAGKAMGFNVTGAAYMTAILPPVLTPQDRSRIAVVDLLPLPTGPEAAAGREAAVAALAAVKASSAMLRRRVIDAWPLFQENLGAWREALLAAGCDMRQADQLGTLLAGRDALLGDPADADAMVDEIDTRLAGIIEDARHDDEDSEAQQCLNHLYASAVDRWHGGQRSTVSEVILEAYDTDGKPARDFLRGIGIRIENWRRSDSRCLCVANEHVGLQRIFKDTRWAGAGWTTALRYFEDARAWPAQLRFAGAKVRATALPAHHLPEIEPDG